MISQDEGAGAVPTETDVWRTAWIIADEYGAEGVGFAGRMAKSFEIGGKAEHQKVWVSIMEKVEALTSPENAATRRSQ
jgi:hypothetical protein